MRRGIRLTAHARERIIERGIEVIDIERIINNPIETIEDKYEETQKSYGKAIDHYIKKSRYVVIIHTTFNSNKEISIITAMWSDKGGLKAYGFREF